MIVRLRAKALLAAFLLLLTACDPAGEPVSAPEIEGLWVTSGSDGRTGTLVFRPDNTFEGKDLPGRVFYTAFDADYGGPPDWSSSEHIEGTWTTGWDAGRKRASVVINIEGRMDGSELEVHGVGAARSLSYYYRDPDSAEFLEFKRGAI